MKMIRTEPKEIAQAQRFSQEPIKEKERCPLEYVSASPDDIQFAHVMELEKNLDRIL